MYAVKTAIPQSNEFSSIFRILMKSAKNFLLGVAVIIGASCSTSVSTQALNPSMKTPILPPPEQPTKKTQPSTPVAVSKIVSSPVAFFGLPPVGQLIKCETKTKVTLGRQAIIENVTYKARILAVDGAGVSKFELLDLQHESSTPNQGGKRRLAKMVWERKGVQWQETITIDGKTEQSPAKFTVGWFLLDTIWNTRRFPKGKLKAGAAWDTNPRLHRMAFGFMFPEAGKSDILPFTAANSPLKCELEKTEMVNGQVIGTTGLGMSKGDRKNGKLFNIKLEGERQHIAGVHLNSLQLKGRLDGQGQGGQIIGVSLQHKESVLERAPVKFLKPGVGAQFAIQDSMQTIP